MVLPDAEIQRPSFPPFASQLEEVEHLQTQYDMLTFFNNHSEPFLLTASPTSLEPLAIHNNNPPTPDFPLLPSPILQRPMDTAPSTPQAPTPGLHRPHQSPRTTPYSDGVPPTLPPHLRTRTPDVQNPSHDATPTPSPNLQTRIDGAPSTPQQPTPGLHRPYQLPRTFTYSDSVPLILPTTPNPQTRIDGASSTPQQPTPDCTDRINRLGQHHIQTGYR